MPDPDSCPPPTLDAVALQQLIATAAEKARTMKTPGPVGLNTAVSEIPVSASAKRAASLSKRLNKARSLLEKAAGDVGRFDEARERESRSLNPARRLGRRHSDHQLSRLFSRIEQALQAVQKEGAPNKSAPAGE